MTRTSSGLLVALLLSIAVPSACGPVEAKVHAPTGDVVTWPLTTPLSVEQARASFWWVEVGEQSVGTAWFSPVMTDVHGFEVRVWTIMCHLPGSMSPISCLQGVVKADDNDSVLLDRQEYRVELAPVPGLAWRSVTSAEQLTATTAGFY